MPPCPRCSGAEVKRDGRVGETPRYRCRACRRTFVARTGSPFAGHRWPQEVIVTAVRWYLRYRLSAADVRDLLAERGVDVSARTVLHWVQQFAPLLAQAGRRAATRLGRRWWCDETYVRVGGKWAYLYRAIDEVGQVVDVLLRARRDLASARAFFVLATYRRRAVPEEVLTDKHPAYARAVREEVPGAVHMQSGLHRASGPDTKPIERSHVPTKDRLRPMRGLQSIRTGQRTIEGVELVRAVRRGHVTPPGAVTDGHIGPHVRARAAAATFAWLADGLRVAA
ncbi:MAG TPA: IS6 family transposase [Herpetosiphonaceae bacterium]|nr:IS6 family transposase [Herpetosiphonaceae bacterium]